MAALPMELKKAGEGLPVVQVIPELCQALADHKRAVLQAPPGAGKTTYVPLALLDQPWLGGKKIIMLEPRRLAAKACAAHMAGLLGEKPGQTIGYQIRMERCMGAETRIEIITEGILTRRLQTDPSLDQVGLVIFDEFHERHIHSDLGLAFCLEAAEAFNPGLRILVMSATMDLPTLSALLDHAPMINSLGRTYPVDLHYLAPLDSTYPWLGIRAACISAVEKALVRETGDILVFLPGAREIQELAQALKTRLSHPGTGPALSILPLAGNLSWADQAAAIAPSQPGRRKIVLATSIAETSLTIEGVRVVIDAGLMRVPRFSPGTGMSRLETIPVSRASADQRQGRAGRTAPGVCYRIWAEHQTQGLAPFNRPEILSADLASLVLELAQWGVSDPHALKWLDLPPQAAFDQARDLLIQLSALDRQGRITDHGRHILAAGVHPRLAHMTLKADQMGQGILACWLAALLGERDILSFRGKNHDPDIRLRLEALEAMGRTPDLNEPLARTVLKNAGKIGKELKIRSRGRDFDQAGRVLAFAWPERVAKKRSNQDLYYLMASGSGAYFKTPNSLSSCPYIVAIHLDGNPRNAGIFLAAPYSEKELEQDFQDQIQVLETVFWDKHTHSVRAVCQTLYASLIVQETSMENPSPKGILACLIREIQQTGLSILPWTRNLRQFQHRALFLRTYGVFPDLPDLSDIALAETLAVWLGPFLDQVHSAAGLKQVDLTAALTSCLTWEQQQAMNTHAPTHLTVPSGSRIPLQYGDDKGVLESPVLAVRLQEMFGLTQTPAIARGRVRVTLHLLSPANRPVQITQDLDSFWKNTYTAVKKDLMGRYPKHYWPEDPVSAMPTCRAKPRG